MDCYHKLIHSISSPAMPSHPSPLCALQGPSYSWTSCQGKCYWCKAMLTAEKQCCKLKMGGVSFFWAMEIPWWEIIFWCLAIKQCKGGNVCSSLWPQFKQKAGITESTRLLSLLQLESHLLDARQLYWQAKCSHWSEGEAFLRTVIIFFILKNNMNWPVLQNGWQATLPTFLLHYATSRARLSIK